MSDPISPIPGLIKQAAAVDYNRTSQLKSDNPSSAKRAGEARLKKATQDFESLFLHNLLKKMRATVPKREKSQFGMETMRDITDEQLAIHLAQQGGVGLGEMLFKSLQEQEHIAETQNDPADRGRLQTESGGVKLDTAPAMRELNRPAPRMREVQPTSDADENKTEKIDQ